jgi:hypothetical protein
LVDDEVYFTEVLYVRNIVKCSNSKFHGILQKKPPSLIKIDLESSNRLLYEMNTSGNVKVNSFFNQINCYKIDGFLQIENKFQYKKIKPHQTIELLYKESNFFDLENIFVPFNFTIKTTLNLIENKIYELIVCLVNKMLIVDRIRPDKIYPDKRSKILGILNNTIHNIRKEEDGGGHHSNNNF